MAKKTWIKNADWMIAWDAAAGRHAYLRGGDLVMSGGSIEFVGQRYGGTADTTVDGSGLLVMPGLVDIHSHPSTEPFFRGIREEHGVPPMYMSGLYERSFAYAPDMNARRFAGEGRLLRDAAVRHHHGGGSVGARSWLDRSRRSERSARVSGTRLRLGALAARGRMAARLQMGRGGGKAALPGGDGADRRGGGASLGSPRRHRLAGADRHLHRGAAARRLRSRARAQAALHHALRAERQRVQRDGAAPRQDADPMGARHRHARVREPSSATASSPTSIPGSAGTATRTCGSWRRPAPPIAHCPSPFARYGQTLEDFGRYRRAGVNIGIGTDVSPHNLIEEMRLGGDPRARRVGGHPQRRHRRSLPRRHRRRCGGAGPRRSRPARLRRQGRRRAGGSPPSPDDAGARSVALSGLYGGGPGGARRLRGRQQGGARRAASSPSITRRRSSGWRRHSNAWKRRCRSAISSIAGPPRSHR